MGVSLSAFIALISLIVRSYHWLYSLQVCNSAGAPLVQSLAGNWVYILFWHQLPPHLASLATSSPPLGSQVVCATCLLRHPSRTPSLGEVHARWREAGTPLISPCFLMLPCFLIQLHVSSTSKTASHHHQLNTLMHSGPLNKSGPAGMAGKTIRRGPAWKRITA